MSKFFTLSLLTHAPPRAALFNHTEIIRFLIDNGADIHQVDVEHRTPLLVAASRGSMDSVKVLLEYHSDPKIKVRTVSVHLVESFERNVAVDS